MNKLYLLTFVILLFVACKDEPAGDAATYNVTGIPTGLAFDAFGFLVGNAPEVSGDTTTNPSDTYTITVTKANDI